MKPERKISGNLLSKSYDLPKELETSTQNPSRKLIIAHLICNFPGFFESYAETHLALNSGYIP